MKERDLDELKENRNQILNHRYKILEKIKISSEKELTKIKE
jgi:DNA-binding CsgD family transcriptional regulator